MDDIYQRLGFPTQEVNVKTDASGNIILRSVYPLEQYTSRLGNYLYDWADKTPEQVFLAEKNGSDSWSTVSYLQALTTVENIAQALLDRELGVADSLVILSGNSIKQALLTLAAMHIGVVVVPVSPPYSLMSSDYKKLRDIVDKVKPALIYVEQVNPFQQALKALAKPALELICGVDDIKAGVTCYDELAAVSVTPAVRKAFDNTGSDTIAKVMFTSGSTGTPKGVINTQRMLCANQKSLQQIWPFVTQQPPVVLDWLPWHHTFGGNHNFNLILANGGSLYIDDGKPRADDVKKTVANLHTVSTTIYFSVPLGYELLIDYLEANAALAQQFFSELKILFSAGSALPNALKHRLCALSEKVLGYEIPVITSWGATETGPLCSSTFFKTDVAGPLGLPVPGVEIKLASRRDERYELRVRGLNITPGYLGDDALTVAAFDEEGFYCMGDAGKLADPTDPAKGIVFDGRLAEEFKLSSGTWVQTGILRMQLISTLAPLIQDVVIAAPDRTEIGVLLIPNIDACAKHTIGKENISLSPGNIAMSADIRKVFCHRLGLFNVGKPGSQSIARAMFLTEPLSVDKGEMTDKGYINQRAVLANRAVLIDELFSGGDRVMIPESTRVLIDIPEKIN